MPKLEHATLDSNSIQRLHVNGLLSEAAVYRGTIYLAGQVAENCTQNIEGQTAEVLGHIDHLLNELGSDKSCILMCQIFLADIKDFEGMNEAWTAWVDPLNAPPRATVEAKLAQPGWLVEMVVTASRR
jgi:enamine deaminase RidA (YjgF/YER057c/UK114 family)